MNLNSMSYGLMVDRIIIAKGSKAAMRKLQREVNRKRDGNSKATLLFTGKAIGERWEPKPTGFEN